MEPLIPREQQASSRHECKGITVDSEELFQKHTWVSDTEAYLTKGERQKRKWVLQSDYLFPRQAGPRMSLHGGDYRQLSHKMLIEYLPKAGISQKYWLEVIFELKGNPICTFQLTIPTYKIKNRKHN
ncbi:UNVERIFIED_CONTAM: hypothetical protein FKN15_019038 [Acipenser sinensis]